MYENNVMKGCCTGEPVSEPMEPMVALTDNIRSVGIDICAMAEKIGANLFGAELRREEKSASPICLHDVMKQHRVTLMETAKILADICCKLGI